MIKIYRKKIIKGEFYNNSLVSKVNNFSLVSPQSCSDNDDCAGGIPCNDDGICKKSNTNIFFHSFEPDV